MILIRENAEFWRGGGFVGATAQFGSVQTGGFDAHEDPVYGWRGGFRIGWVSGEAGGWGVGAGGGEDGGGHGAGGDVEPGRHDGKGGLMILWNSRLFARVGLVVGV